ncbi:MAG: hypothetical protein DWI21_01990 [Planctomycetota bacterium]|nr:MAG: hypothetical protein DWI21_01990 [Planctomycetota bacterium]
MNAENNSFRFRKNIVEQSQEQATQDSQESSAVFCRTACPVCGGTLIEIRHKLQCEQCHTICETCCEGGRG